MGTIGNALGTQVVHTLQDAVGEALPVREAPQGRQAHCHLCGQVVPTMAMAQLHVAGACMYNPHFWDWAYVYVDRDMQLWGVKRLKGQGGYVRAKLDDAELGRVGLTKQQYLMAAAPAVNAQPLLGKYMAQPEHMSLDYFRLCKRDGFWALRGLKADPTYKLVQAVSAKLGPAIVHSPEFIWEPFSRGGADAGSYPAVHEPWQAVMWGDATIVFPELPSKPPHLNSLMAMPDPLYDKPVVSFSHLERVHRPQDTAHYPV